MEIIEVDYQAVEVMLSTTEGTCPYCGATDDVQWQGPIADGASVYYTGYCGNCNNDFKEWYELSVPQVWGKPIKKQE